MSRIKSNIVISLLLAFISLVLYFFAKDFPDTSKNFPIIILLIILLLSLGQIGVSVYRFKNLNQKNFNIPITPLLVFGLSFFCVILMEYIGFFSSFAILFISLLFLFKIKNKKSYLLGAIILFFFIFIVFEFGLKVSLLKIGF